MLEGQLVGASTGLVWEMRSVMRDVISFNAVISTCEEVVPLQQVTMVGSGRKHARCFVEKKDDGDDDDDDDDDDCTYVCVYVCLYACV